MDDERRKPKTFAIYVRSATVSPEAIKRQAEACRDFGLSEEMEEAVVYVDDGQSGASTSRPGLSELLERAAEGEFDMVIVERTDRLSRDAVALDGLIETLAACGVTVVSVTDGVVKRLGHGAFAHRLIKRAFNDVASGMSSADVARGFNRDRIPREKLIRWEDARAVRERYMRRGYTDVVVSIEAVDKDGVVHTWRDPEVA